MSSSRITPKRQFVQMLLIVAAFLLPFITIAGNPFLRIDIALRTLFLAGIAIRIDQLFLVLLATLFIIAAFLLLTVILGRVWCGWLCPQTVFNDLTELISSRFRKKMPEFSSKLIEHFTALVLSKLIAFNILSWFIPPGQLVSFLVNIPENPLLFSCFLSLTLFGYLNLIMVKRSFCRSYCPYGRFQAALMDKGTLNLAFLEETRHKCLRCGACVRTCPMEIDIREGFQIECIGCGRCIDACRDVMEKRSDAVGLIDYRFGKLKGSTMQFGSKAIALSVLTLFLGVALFWGMSERSQTAFAIQRVATVEPRLMPDGFLMNTWRATIGNRSELPKNYSIRILAAEPDEAALLGPVSSIKVPANEHREVVFVIRNKGKVTEASAMRLQLVDGEKTVAEVPIRP